MKELLQNPIYQKRLGIGAAVIILGLASYAIFSNITHKPKEVKNVPIVRTITVGENASAAATVYPGEIRGRYESQLAFQVGGKINARLVNVGDNIKAGQVLLTLDAKDVSQSVEASSAQLASAHASYKLAADNAARYAALYAQGAVSEAVRDQYNTQLEAASAALRQAQAQANVSSNQLGYTQLVSDTDGVVTALNGEVGQVVPAGTPIATVVRSGEREVQINVPEDAKVSLGQQASISFWALPKVQVTGFVREIASMADPLTRTFKVCVAIKDLPDAAKLGMTAKVSFVNNASLEAATTSTSNFTSGKPTAFTLPTTALYQVNNKTQVWIVREGRAEPVDVVIGSYVGNNVQIIKGLNKGDNVIIAGLGKLTPQQEVRLEQGGEQ